ncbi:hypothetical protein QL285_002522 [Trifolium repens]|nr:hypothetical protein QL285_002522 [Trifolium repens]
MSELKQISSHPVIIFILPSILLRKSSLEVKIHLDLYPSSKIPNLDKEFQLGFYRSLKFAQLSLRSDPVRVRELPSSSTKYFAQAIPGSRNNRARENLLRAREIGRSTPFFRRFLAQAN